LQKKNKLFFRALCGIPQSALFPVLSDKFLMGCGAKKQATRESISQATACFFIFLHQNRNEYPICQTNHGQGVYLAGLKVQNPNPTGSDFGCLVERTQPTANTLQRWKRRFQNVLLCKYHSHGIVYSSSEEQRDQTVGGIVAIFV